MKMASKQAWIFTAAIAMGAATPVAAQDIYKYVDENGNLVFTDRPPTPDSEPITLRELSVVEAPTYASVGTASQAAADADGPSMNELRRRYRDFRLVSPAPEQNLWGTGQVATISWDTSAPLSDGVSVIYYLNGEAVTEPTRASTFDTPPMDRGAHQARADLITEDNRVIASAGPVTFHIKQNSRQFNRAR